MPKIRVVDLFAGPGGLGEGFAGFCHGNRRPFSIEFSVEKEQSAHRTLQLRAFVRQFGEPPEAYYDYVRGDITKDELFRRYPAKARKASEETLQQPCELGDPDGDRIVFDRLRQVVANKDTPVVVIGGPPCQAYSLVGRARNRGIANYDAAKDRRHFLYEDYLRVLEKARPEVFVMENVKGILSARVNETHIFPKILDDLICPTHAVNGRRGPSYHLFSLSSGNEVSAIQGSGEDCVIRTEFYGIPQARHRVILLGVRHDIGRRPLPLNLSESGVTTKQCIDSLPRLRSGLSKMKDSPSAWHNELCKQGRLVKHELGQTNSKEEVEKFLDKSKSIRKRGGRYIRSARKYSGPAHLRDWLHDETLKGFLNHETRGHISADLGRYLYCACFAKINDGVSPRSSEFPSVFAPSHRNWQSGKFADRFKVQAAHRPSSTITSHISKDGHYFIHYDPAQCRSLTVREAARLQTFPDNYFFEGNRTQQYVQVGNAVPPWLARQIAAIVYELVR